MAFFDTVQISEIFFSLQGESSRVGCPTAFIRLVGCPLRCGYCDSSYAFQGGTPWTIEAILTHLQQWNVQYVTVTGGEPLAQKYSLSLLTALCEAGYAVSLETSGALSIAEVDPRVMCVVDLKTPASGEIAQNHWDNLRLLKQQDELKFVLCDEGDYLWARGIVFSHRLAERCTVLFSPVAEGLSPTLLAHWILRDQLPVRFQLQLHKLLWGARPGV